MKREITAHKDSLLFNFMQKHSVTLKIKSKRTSAKSRRQRRSSTILISQSVKGVLIWIYQFRNRCQMSGPPCRCVQLEPPL